MCIIRALIAARSTGIGFGFGAVPWGPISGYPICHVWGPMINGY